MANTNVVFRDEIGVRIPSVPKVAIVATDTVTFSVEDGADSTLCFSLNAASILSPAPDAQVGLATGQTLTYTFTSSTPGAYGVVALDPQVPVPQSLNFGGPTDPPLLVVHAGRGLIFTVRDIPTQT
jgi:hypothetical protein